MLARNPSVSAGTSLSQHVDEFSTGQEAPPVCGARGSLSPCRLFPETVASDEAETRALYEAYSLNIPSNWVASVELDLVAIRCSATTPNSLK
jgi:hypothetical protein